MSVTLQLNEMTVSEKLELLDAIWADLSRDPDALESPDWHREVLEQREHRIQAGEAHFTKWEQAKEEIRNKVS